MKQKILFCCFVLSALLAPWAASAQSGACGVNLSWTLDGNTLTISGEGDMYEYNSPNTYSYSIYKENIENVVFSDGVTSVSSNSFDGYTNLTSVQLSNTIRSLGKRSFSRTNLSEIKLPSSISRVGDYAFADNLQLREVYWDADIPFEECAGNDIHGWGNSPHYFFDNDSIKKITFGPNVKYIYDQLMASVETPYEIVSNGKIEYVGGEAFEGSIWYEQNKGNDVLYFEKCLYSCGNGLSTPTHIIVKEGTKSITTYAFRNNRYITGITVPESLSIIGLKPFEGCTSLSKAVWNSKNCSITSNSSLFYDSLSEITFGNKVESIPARLCSSCKSLKSLSFPESLRVIGEYAFSYNSGLENVTFNENLDSIAPDAFNCCEKIKKVHLTARVVDTRAFVGCGNVTELTIGPNVRKIKDSNFGGANIQQLTLPKTLEYVENLASVGHIQNVMIECPNAAEVLQYAFEDKGAPNRNVVHNMEFAEGVKTCQPINVTDTLIIPSTVEKFSFRSSAKTLIYKAISAENGIEIAGCDNIIIADGVKRIPDDFASSCKITKLVFPSSVTEIGASFNSCYDLTEVEAPWYDPREINTSAGAFYSYSINNATLYVPKGREEAY